MSNRRIKKKRAKAAAEAAWQRDKSTLIANFLVWIDPDASRDEYLRTARIMWKWNKDTLFRRIDEMMTYRLRLTSPFRMMRDFRDEHLDQGREQRHSAAARP